METLNVISRILGINRVLGDETPSIGAKDTVHSETTRKTRNTSEHRLKGLLHVMIGVIFEDWEKKKKEEEEEECVLVKRSCHPTNQVTVWQTIYIRFDSHIQLTL